MKSFRSYQYQHFVTSEGMIANGDYIFKDDGFVIRLKNGYLNDAADEDGNVLPAVEFIDGSHVEHWKNGALHCEKEPAVIDSVDGYEEWWLNGRKVLPLNGGSK